MIHILIGAAVMTGLLLLVHTLRRRRIPIKWWQWFFILLGFIYLTFLLELIVGFLEEGTPKGALVMGTILGFAAAVWAFLLKRSLISPQKSRGRHHA